MKTLIATLAIGMMMGCSYVRSATASDDRSFYHEIDRNDWPGNDMSEAQVDAAIAHFKDPHPCSKPWRWALIGPNKFLLEGTDYVLTRVTAANGFVPNLHYSKGYWSGEILETMSIPAAKSIVQSQANDDCRYEHKTPRKP